MNNDELIPIILQNYERGDPPIKATLKAIGDNEGWFSGLKILPYYDECAIFWLIGERRIGKTDLLLRVACLLWLVFKLKTVWIRNKLVELQDPENSGGFLNDAYKMGWCPETWTIRPDGIHEGPEKESETIFKFMSISTFSNARGGAHPDVEMMVFDEFVPENMKYPKMCASGILSLTKTVFSGRDTSKLFCCSNFVAVANPYFVKMRIYPAKNRDVTFFPEKAMLIERCNGYRCAISKDSLWNRAYRSAGIGNYANEEEDERHRLIKPIPKGATPEPYVIMDDGIVYRGWSKNGVIYYGEYKGSLDNIVIYTPNLKECSDRVNLIMPWIRRHIDEDMQAGVIRFKDPNTMFSILSLAYDAV